MMSQLPMTDLKLESSYLDSYSRVHFKINNICKIKDRA